MTLALTAIFAPTPGDKRRVSRRPSRARHEPNGAAVGPRPPSYIQVKGLRTAWQYCPRRFFIRFLDEYVREERPVFVTVWFDNGRVVHMRAYPTDRMGECEDFLAAFRWEDDIGGGMVDYRGGQRIK